MNQSQVSDGIGFFGLLALLFIGLRLAGIIHWSWLWVLAPLWVPVALLVLLVIFAFISRSIFYKRRR